MNVLNRVTWNTLKKNRTRTIVTIIGVILSAAMITAVTTFVSTMQDYMIRSVISQDGGMASALQRPAGGSAAADPGQRRNQGLRLSISGGLCRPGGIPEPG